MSRIIHFTADDLGLDEQTNLAIEQDHQRGVLTAASLMLGQPGTAHAVEIARRIPHCKLASTFMSAIRNRSRANAGCGEWIAHFAWERTRLGASRRRCLLPCTNSCFTPADKATLTTVHGWS